MTTWCFISGGAHSFTQEEIILDQAKRLINTPQNGRRADRDYDAVTGPQVEPNFGGLSRADLASLASDLTKS